MHRRERYLGFNASFIGLAAIAVGGGAVSFTATPEAEEANA
jgi:hypothetical protein